jgi:hypothetical protein
MRDAPRMISACLISAEQSFARSASAASRLLFAGFAMFIRLRGLSASVGKIERDGASQRGKTAGYKRLEGILDLMNVLANFETGENFAAEDDQNEKENAGGKRRANFVVRRKNALRRKRFGQRDFFEI